MLPVLNAIVQKLVAGPNKTYINSDNETFTPPPLAAMFTNDGQINQLVSVIGVFDDQEPLPATHIPPNQVRLLITSLAKCIYTYLGEIMLTEALLK